MNVRAQAIAIATVVAGLGHGVVTTAGTMPVGTVFTYQGQLKQSGNPVTATADFQFRLFDVESAGNPIAPMHQVNNVIVNEGQFTVELDFGQAFCEGEARWVGISVRSPAGSGSFTTLAPRQPIHSVPMAQYALCADGAGVMNINAGNITSGTVPNAQLSGLYSNAMMMNNPANSFTGSFFGNGSNLFSINAVGIEIGNLNVARLPTGGNWNLSSILNIDSNTLVIDPASNRVGIGTSTPSAALHVNDVNGAYVGDGGTARTWIGAASNVNWIQSGSAAWDASRLLRFSGFNANVGTFAFTGNVGIGATGSTTPLLPLDVVGTGGPAAASGSGVNGLIRVKPDNSSAVLDIGATGGGAHGWLQARDAGSYALNYNLSLNPNGGNVGVGTSSPTAKLDVAGAIRVRANNPLADRVTLGASGLSYGSIGSGFQFTNTNNLYQYDSAALQPSRLGFENGGFIFFTAPSGSSGNTVNFTNVTRITNGGDMAIGSQFPTNPLHISKPGTSTGGYPGSPEVVARFQNTGADGSAISIDDPGSNDSVLYLSNQGDAKWGIRSDANGFGAGNYQMDIRLHAGGNNLTMMEMSYEPFGGGPGGLVYTEFFTPIEAPGFVNTSDVRAKRDIQDVTDGLHAIMQLRPVSYLWKDDADEARRSIGLIAQEVEPIVPEAVEPPKNPTDMYGVKYASFVPLLIDAVQTQQQTIEELRQHNSDLENRLAAMERAMQILLADKHPVDR